jgi:hypothetical protein
MLKVSYTLFHLLLTANHIASTLATAETHQDPGPSAAADLNSEEQQNEIVALCSKYCEFVMPCVRNVLSLWHFGPVMP